MQALDLDQLHIAEATITWQGDDCKVIKSTTLSSVVAIDVKPDELHLNSFLQEDGLEDRWWNSSVKGVVKLFFQQLLPLAIFFHAA